MSITVPRYVQAHRPTGGQDRLATMAIARVATSVPSRVADFIAEVVGHLSVQRPLGYSLGHLGQQHSL